jgi:hypothetical protein
LLQGIYFYQKTHMEELQLEKTKNAIRQVFIDTGITPFEDGRWNQYRRERFTNHRRTSIANHILSNVLKLQDKKCISAYLFSIGLDDQDPSQWDDADLSHLVVPDTDYPSDSEEEGEEEEEEEEDQRGEGGGSAATEVRGKNGSRRSAEDGEGRPLVPLTSTDHDVPYPAGCRRPGNLTRAPRPASGSRAGEFCTSWVPSSRSSTQLQQQCRRPREQ